MNEVDRFRRATELIDAANAQDPNRLETGAGPRPKELVHAELLTEWIRRLEPEPSEALLLAARAHHIRRWVVPRSSYPPGRASYLQWRRDLHRFHADEVGAILERVGYDAGTITRVQQIVRKERLTLDPEVQTLEDGLCLVFLQLQLDSTAESVGDEGRMVEVLRKSWRKMSPAGREFALRLELSDEGRSLVRRALGD
ncbi:MAG: DUF4202 domain-containing protein [Dehalococcoidia bacterium]|nr:DUF4202 domain-containing protein [Dehalococcoidia bacterium]HRC61671.1 DUF4202 domain-containing protein [Dehalococcoidia bacterium]